ncbi:MAG: ABC transporter permease [Desulfobulbaceae bacterium]|nr:ABC transporter permease [Desulfobulbaceae bacterium]
MLLAKNMREIKLGIKSLMQHKLRSSLTMLGMVFGVGSVIAMLAVGEGASKQALEEIRKLGSNNIIITAQKPMDEQGQQKTRILMSIYGLLYEDVERIAQSFAHVLRVVPVKIIRKQGRLTERAMDMRILGTTPDWFKLVQRPLIAGRTLAPYDLENFSNVVVLTEYGARRLLATRSTLGQTIRLGSDYFEIIGIIQNESSQGGALQSPDQQIDAYIPINVAKANFGDVFTQSSAGSRTRELVELHQIIAEVDQTTNVESTAAGIEAMLERFHKKKDYVLSVPLALLRQAEATKRTFNIVLGSIAGISLLVGGIGIMNIMLASVTERTREIGIRRAIGAKRSQIVRQFLIETVVLSTTGGLIGIAIGLFIPWMITTVAKMPTVVTPSSLILSLGISMAIGIIFGIYPAVRAAALDPIIALRHE